MFPIIPLFLSRPSWPVVAVACLAAGAVWAVHAQDSPAAEPPAPPPEHTPPLPRATPAQDSGTRIRMSESVRRYGRENRGGRILGVEPIRLNNRNLNRIKTVDDRGRVRVRIDDPQPAPEQPASRPELQPPAPDSGT